MIFGVDKASCNAGCIGCETSRNSVFRARPPAGCRSQHLCGACLRPTCRKAGCIRDRNTHQSGDIRFGRLRQGYIATRAKWSVEQLQRQPTRFAIRQSFRIVWVEQLQPFRELWYAQAIHARCFDSFPLFLNFRI